MATEPTTKGSKMAKIIMTITVDTDYPAHKAKNAVLDALYEARWARGADYVSRNPNYKDLDPEEYAAKVEATNEKREFYYEMHCAVCSGDFEEVS